MCQLFVYNVNSHVQAGHEPRTVMKAMTSPTNTSKPKMRYKPKSANYFILSWAAIMSAPKSRTCLALIISLMTKKYLLTRRAVTLQDFIPLIFELMTLQQYFQSQEKRNKIQNFLASLTITVNCHHQCARCAQKLSSKARLDTILHVSDLVCDLVCDPVCDLVCDIARDLEAPCE